MQANFCICRKQPFYDYVQANFEFLPESTFSGLGSRGKFQNFDTMAQKGQFQGSVEVE
jgi:hypothetical protein